MSVNYYARTTEQDTAGEEGLHIGQHVGGREFLFQAHPQIRSCADWWEYLSRPGMLVWTESHYTVPLAEFWADATKRPADVGGLRNMRSAFDGERSNLSGLMAVRQFRDYAARGVPFADYDFC